MRARSPVLSVMTVSVLWSVAGCTDEVEPPTKPTPPVIASAYILPGATSLGDHAFGDEPIVIHPGERLRWVNVDTLAHHVVADSPNATDFHETGELAPGGEQSFDMTRLGTTALHCTDHPVMTGTLIVRNP